LASLVTCSTSAVPGFGPAQPATTTSWTEHGGSPYRNLP
jgi:hypothetical protein